MTIANAAHLDSIQSAVATGFNATTDTVKAYASHHTGYSTIAHGPSNPHSDRPFAQTFMSSGSIVQPQDLLMEFNTAVRRLEERVQEACRHSSASGQRTLNNIDNRVDEFNDATFNRYEYLLGKLNDLETQVAKRTDDNRLNHDKDASRRSNSYKVNSVRATTSFAKCISRLYRLASEDKRLLSMGDMEAVTEDVTHILDIIAKEDRLAAA